MVGFLDVDTGEIRQFGIGAKNKIRRYIKDATLIGFNNSKFDDVCLSKMIQDKSNAEDIWQIAIELIEMGGKPWHYERIENLTIDLMSISAGDGSLKLKGARIGTKSVQELPYNPKLTHSDEQWQDVISYNVNDLYITLDLYNYLKEDIELRYSIRDKFSVKNALQLSSPQIAERILQRNATRGERSNSVEYLMPKSELIPRCLKHLPKRLEFEVNQTNGSPILTDKSVYTIGRTSYRMGLGGLHSTEKNLVQKGVLRNVDVVSYYPSLILQFNKELQIPWIEDYATFYERRNGVNGIKGVKGFETESNVIKLILNGSFGKLGSVYSPLYNPELLLKVTLTGQIYLLKLIEMLTDAGGDVFSANTDGVEVTNITDSRLGRVVGEWERLTKLKMEFGEYKELYARDVNNYIAIYNGYAKRKGIFAKPSIEKNSEHPIIYEALVQYYLNGIPLEDTIRGCKDMNQFALSRQVTGGAVFSTKQYKNTDEYEAYIKKVPFKRNMALEKRNEKSQQVLVLEDGEYLGKVVRFYYSTKGYTLYYKKSGNKVPKADGVRELMRLVQRDDLDYERYIDIAREMLL